MTTELELPAKTAPKALVPYIAKPIELGSIQADLDAYKADCMTITVSGPDDRAGRDLAYTNRQKVKSTRIAFEKAIDASLVGPKAYIKEVTEMEKPMVIEFKAIEAHLAAQEKIVDDAIEAAKRQKEQDEADRIAARINALNLLGARYENSVYDVCGVLIDSIEVTALPDNEFRDLLDSATAAHNTEQTRLAEIEAERVAEVERVAAEQKRIADEQEAERVRLQAIADENRRAAHELAVQQAEFARVQREAANERERLAKEESDRVAAKEKAELTARIDSRIAQMLTSGFDKSQHGNTYADPSREYVLYPDEIGKLSEKGFLDMLLHVEQIRIDAAANEAARLKAEKAADVEKKRADKERAKRLAPDKNKLSKFFVVTGNSPKADVKEDEAIDLQIEFLGRLHELVKEFQSRLTDL